MTSVSLPCLRCAISSLMRTSEGRWNTFPVWRRSTGNCGTGHGQPVLDDVLDVWLQVYTLCLCLFHSSCRSCPTRIRALPSVPGCAYILCAMVAVFATSAKAAMRQADSALRGACWRMCARQMSAAPSAYVCCLVWCPSLTQRMAVSVGRVDGRDDGVTSLLSSDEWAVRNSGLTSLCCDKVHELHGAVPPEHCRGAGGYHQPKLALCSARY